LDLSTYEYAALEERYHTLASQLSEHRKLNMTYADIIKGTSSYEDEDVSIEQLRKEAGREGLRMKALEADVLRPVARDAGGPQALVSQALSVRELIEQAGSLEELKGTFMDAQMLRLRVNEVGGLHGLDHLVSTVQSLRSEQQEYAELKAKLDGPDGLQAKATKYTLLQQAFAVIDNSSALNSTPSEATPSEATVPMNPARARLINSTPDYQDPDRDLYEPKLLMPNSSRKTGSNDVPLGPLRSGKRSADQSSSDWRKKRRPDDGKESNAARRPRVDVDRASAMVHATLSPSIQGSSTAPFVFGRPTIGTNQFTFEYGNEHGGRLHAGSSYRPEAVQRDTTKLTGDSYAAVGTNVNNNMIGLVDRSRSPVIKTEDLDDAEPFTPSIGRLRTSTKNVSNAKVLVGGLPIALWIGESSPAKYNPDSLIKASDIPSDLAEYLFGEMKKYLMVSTLHAWNEMPANPDTCILRYLIDGHRPSGQPQDLRTCKSCSSGWVKQHRPCALLLDVYGVRTVVFLPLRDAVRRNVAWTEKKFWVMHA
jgi:hypothetical protein